MDSLIARMRWIFSPRDKVRFMMIALLMALSALLELVGIGILLGAATLFLSPDSAAGGEVARILARLLPGVRESYRVAWAICAIGVMLTLKNLFALFIADLQARFIFAKRNDLARRVFSGFIHADYESYARLSPDFCFGTIFRINDMGNLVLLPAMQVLADVMVIGILAAASVALFPVITVSGIAAMAVSAAAVYAFTSRANRSCGEQRLREELAENKYRMIGIAGEKTIKCAAKEDFFLDAFTRAYRSVSRFARKLYTLGQLPRLSLESAAVLLACGVFAVMVVTERPATEILLTFAVLTAAVSRILPALSRCHYNLTLIRQNRPILDEIYSLLKTLPLEESPRGDAADAGKTIEVRDLSFAYCGGSPLFRNFSMIIEPGSSTAIAGRSGRGKSTLADLLMGLLKPSSGTITAGGRNIAGDLPGWRRQVGLVPQNIFLMEGSLRENVAFGEAPEEIDDRRVAEALKAAGLTEFPPDHPISAQGNLSGGQRQRIGIARALYRKVKLLILDEATSALDAETENSFCEVLRKLRGKVTLLVISHRESTLEVCDRRIDL